MLAQRAYPGSTVENIPNPNGVVSLVPCRCAATPLGFVGTGIPTPKVARASQPWVLSRNPFGIRQPGAILDEIARLLARHHGFMAEELDFILNHDLKESINFTRAASSAGRAIPEDQSNANSPRSASKAPPPRLGMPAVGSWP